MSDMTLGSVLVSCSVSARCPGSANVAGMPSPDAAPVPPLNRAQRRRGETRRRLVAAATAAIGEGGVAAVRIREITERADVGRGSFYNHFDSIDDLVAAVAAETLQTMATTLAGDILDDADPAVVAAIAAAKTVQIATDDPELARLIVNLDHASSLYMDTITPYARRLLQRGLDAGRFRLTNVDMSAITIAGGGLAVIRAILSGTAPPDPATTHARTVLDSLGIPADEAEHLSRLHAHA